MAEHFWFFIALAYIALHEMDAMRCHEWRIFPLTFFLPESAGFLVFSFAHIPLFFWVFRSIYLPTGGLNETFIFYFDVFCIVHFVAHLLYLLHPKNEFKDLFSWLVISLAAVAGLLDLVL